MGNMDDNKQDDNTAENPSQDKNELDFILEDMVVETPEVQQHVVDQEFAEAPHLIKDSNGDVFDENIHILKDGKPSLTKTGRFRKKKATSSTSADESESLAAAEVVQGLKRQTYAALLDFEYGDDLHKIHVGETARYFDSEGGVTLTPLQSLLLLEGVLLMRGIQTPTSKKKLTGVKAWFASKWVKFKGRKKNGTYTGNRAVDEREDNARQKVAT